MSKSFNRHCARAGARILLRIKVTKCTRARRRARMPNSVQKMGSQRLQNRPTVAKPYQKMVSQQSRKLALALLRSH
eukprot:5220211-Pyramimonas_sp.AAC.1